MPTTNTRFRILTYNIHKAIGVDRKFAPERIAEILRHHDADIVLLQEVDRYAPRSGHHDLASLLARELSYRYRATGMNVTLKKGRYGNTTLTRFPIGRQRNIDLTITWRKKRGAQHTRLMLTNGGSDPYTLDVFNIHLSLAARIRKQQVRRLLDTPDVTHLGPDDPCIIAGDMNDWPGVLKRNHFKPAGFECATNHNGSRWSIKSFPSYAPASGLDKIFYRGRLKLLHCHRSRLKIAKIASDHLPVIAEFELLPQQ